MNAVDVSTSRSSVLADSTCMLHSLACIKHASPRVCIYACPRRPPCSVGIRGGVHMEELNGQA
jgi:hypothetical protein